MYICICVNVSVKLEPTHLNTAVLWFSIALTTVINYIELEGVLPQSVVVVHNYCIPFMWYTVVWKLFYRK